MAASYCCWRGEGAANTAPSSLEGAAASAAGGALSLSCPPPGGSRLEVCREFGRGSAPGNGAPGNGSSADCVPLCRCAELDVAGGGGDRRPLRLA